MLLDTMDIYGKVVPEIGSNIYFISDIHAYCDRTLDTMSGLYGSHKEYLIDLSYNWNTKVKKDDYVFILGDVTTGLWSKGDNTKETLVNKVSKFYNMLNGRKILISGNHDIWIKGTEIEKCFEEIHYDLMLGVGKSTVCLSHYPRYDWAGRRNNNYNLYGHVHYTMYKSGYKLFNDSKGKTLNTCVMVNNFVPCTLEELIENNTKIFKNLEVPIMNGTINDETEIKDYLLSMSDTVRNKTKTALFQ